ncbi:MAG TPA: SpoIIE family protein phosphatase [Firmicutes bacterium]|nr:SpoIIE family protein phosphatase [Candidatus Fermentithermobacillaceae bacterium]
MDLEFDVGKSLVPKTGETISGDTIEVYDTGSSTTVILADGLGSGVIANVISSLTAKSAVDMLDQGIDLDSIAEILAKSLPDVANNTDVGYSTFTIVQVLPDGTCSIIEYNNPRTVIVENDVITEIPRQTFNVSGKQIHKCHFQIQEGSWIILVSDGVINAGVGVLWNHGWGQERLESYISRVIHKFNAAEDLCRDLCDVCQTLYSEKISDDVSIAAILSRKTQV